MDWNWFFSSFAQSAAAIVGVMGAFLISVVMYFLQKQSQYEGKMRELLSEFEALKGKIHRADFGKWDLYVIDRKKSVIQAMLRDNVFKGLNKNEIIEELLNLFIELYGTETAREELERIVKEYYREQRMKEEEEKKMGIFTDGIIKSMLHSTTYTPTYLTMPLPRWEGIKELKDYLDSLKIESMKMMTAFENLKDAIEKDKNNIGHISFLSLLLGGTALLSVVCPLAFMPLRFSKDTALYSGDTYIGLGIVKFALIVLMTFVIVSIFYSIYYYMRNIEKEYGSVIKRIEDGKYTEFEAYSDYFNPRGISRFDEVLQKYESHTFEGGV